MIPGNPRRYPSITPIFQARPNLVSYLDRIDPLYEVTWRDGVNMDWYGIQAVRHELQLSSNGQLQHVRVPVPSPIDISERETHSNQAVQIMAVLIQFYQLSTYQVATLLGTTTNRVTRSLSALYASGVIEQTIPQWIEEGTAIDRGDSGSGSLWRIDGRSQQLETWLNKLQPLEYSLLTGGADVIDSTNRARSHSTLRHNFAAAEIMTRVMEVVPGALGVWGEQFTKAVLLIDPDLRQTNKIRENVGDGVVVTRDGKLIILEVSGASKLENKSNGPRLQEKAANWAAVAALSDLDIRVIFVNIATGVSPRRFRHHVQLGVEATDQLISTKRLRDRGKESIFIADAHEWFPFELSIGRGFETLEAWSPVTEAYHQLVPTDTELDVDSDIVINTIGSIHTPKWALGAVQEMTSSL